MTMIERAPGLAWPGSHVQLRLNSTHGALLWTDAPNVVARQSPPSSEFKVVAVNNNNDNNNINKRDQVGKCRVQTQNGKVS